MLDAVHPSVCTLTSVYELAMNHCQSQLTWCHIEKYKGDVLLRAVRSISHG